MVHENMYLQSAWNLYGEEHFTFDVVEYCKAKEIREKENFWIYKTESYKEENGFNISRLLLPEDREKRRKQKNEIDIWIIDEIEYTTIECFSKYTGITGATLYSWIYKGMPVVESNKNKCLVLFNESLEWIIKNKERKVKWQNQLITNMIL